MEAREHDHRRTQEIGRERCGRDRLDPAFIGRWTEHEAAHHQKCGEDKSRDDMEGVRSDHRRAALQTGQGPEQCEHDGGDREPAPQPDPRQAEGRRGDDGEIDIERPEVRLLRRNQNGRDECRGDAEAGQRRSMQQRRGERTQRHQSEQDERGGGREKIVKRVGRVHRGERHGCAGGGEDGGNVGDRQRGYRGDALLAARPFARRQQRQRKRSPEQGAHAGPEQAGVDRVTDHEEAAQRQRQAADPDHPAGADAFLETGSGLSGGAGAAISGIGGGAGGQSRRRPQCLGGFLACGGRSGRSLSRGERRRSRACDSRR